MCEVDFRFDCSRVDFFEGLNVSNEGRILIKVIFTVNPLNAT